MTEQCATPFELFHRQLQFMLRAVLPKAQRREFVQFNSREQVHSFLDANLFWPLSTALGALFPFNIVSCFCFIYFLNALIFKWSWKYIFIRRIRNFFIYKSPPKSAHSFLFLFSNQNYKYNYDNGDQNSSFRNQNAKRVWFPNSIDVYNRPQNTAKAKFNLNSTYFDILCTPPQKIL